MGNDEFRLVQPGGSGARRALSRYFDELAARFPEGFDGAAALEESAGSFTLPHGLFVVAGDPDDPDACGAVVFLDDERAEIKRMWVSPAARGRGLATRLLSHLEGLIRGAGRSTAVLDTNRVLSEAVALYRRNGYEPTDRYNDNPYAHHWFRKDLRAQPASQSDSGSRADRDPRSP